MSVTFNMIIDELERRGMSCTSRLSFPSRGMAEVLPLHSASTFEGDCLYVCSLAAWKKLAAENRPANSICITERLIGSDEVDALLASRRRSRASQTASKGPDENMTIVHTELTIQEMYYLLVHFFTRICTWDMSLQRAVLKDEGIERVLELSKAVVENHICISDSSLKLVCVTQGNIPEDDPVIMSLLKNGYHTNDVIGDFRRTNRLDRWERNTGQLLVNTDRDLTPYDTVTRIFKYNRRSFLYVVMTCNVVPLSDGLLDLFRDLVDVLSFAAEREWSKADMSAKPAAVFLDDALAKRQDGGALEARARALHLSPQGHWIVAVLKNVQPEHYSIDRFITELSHILDEEGIHYRDNRIVIWKALPGNDADAFAGLQHALMQLADDYDMRCGISTVFDALGDIYRALEQAEAVADCPVRIEPLLHEAGENALQDGCGEEAGRNTGVGKGQADAEPDPCSFDECLGRCMVAALEPDASLYLSSTFGRRLMALADAKGKGHQDDIRILYVFLSCERNAAETGRRLFMHRNTVLYRIGTIRESIGCSLESPYERFCIMQLCQLILARTSA